MKNPDAVYLLGLLNDFHVEIIELKSALREAEAPNLLGTINEFFLKGIIDITKETCAYLESLLNKIQEVEKPC